MDPKFYLRKLSIPEQLRKYSLPEHPHKLNVNVNSGMSKLRRRKKVCFIHNDKLCIYIFVVVLFTNFTSILTFETTKLLLILYKKHL